VLHCINVSVSRLSVLSLLTIFLRGGGGGGELPVSASIVPRCFFHPFLALSNREQTSLRISVFHKEDVSRFTKLPSLYARRLFFIRGLN
jgi:hypothetical protein